jgi:hypothetical protein
MGFFAIAYIIWDIKQIFITSAGTSIWVILSSLVSSPFQYRYNSVKPLIYYEQKSDEFNFWMSSSMNAMQVYKYFLETALMMQHNIIEVRRLNTNTLCNCVFSLFCEDRVKSFRYYQYLFSPTNLATRYNEHVRILVLNVKHQNISQLRTMNRCWSP